MMFAPTVQFVVLCTDALGGAPLANQEVYAFDDVNGNSAIGATDAQGKVRLNLATNTLDRLYVLAGSTWGVFQQSVPITNGTTIRLALERVLPTHLDAIRRLYTVRRFVGGAGVTVGVLDTGVGPHADLNLLGGRCTVLGQPPNSYADVDVHGTHVAGLIGDELGWSTEERQAQVEAYRVSVDAELEAAGLHDAVPAS